MNFKNVTAVSVLGENIKIKLTVRTYKVVSIPKREACSALNIMSCPYIPDAKGKQNNCSAKMQMLGWFFSDLE